MRCTIDGAALLDVLWPDLKDCLLNALNSANYFTFHDGFIPLRMFAGERFFEMLTGQRRATIFGIASDLATAATYYIDDLYPNKGSNNKRVI